MLQILTENEPKKQNTQFSDFDDVEMNFNLTFSSCVGTSAYNKIYIFFWCIHCVLAKQCGPYGNERIIHRRDLSISYSLVVEKKMRREGNRNECWFVGVPKMLSALPLAWLPQPDFGDCF